MTSRIARPVHQPSRSASRGTGPAAGSSSRRHRPSTAQRGAAPTGQAASRQPVGTPLDAALSAAQKRPAPLSSFTDVGLPAVVVDVLRRAGIERPTEIQAKTLPDALAGRDVLGRAQTGSGKTLGFGLPMLTRLGSTGKPRTARDPGGLVLVPTRELAQQVADALAPVAEPLHLTVGVVVGGVSINRQIDQLRRGVDVLIATPGRLIDLLDRNAVRLDAVEVAVLDEADHMADLGFMPAVTRILDATPNNRQGLFFSATLDQAVTRLVTRYLTDPAVHAAGPIAASAAAMDHQVLVIERDDKVTVAAEIGARPGRTLFFVRTKHGAARLATQLTRLGVETAAIHGNLNQNQRTRALEAFTSGRCRVLTATDVAARGLHVDDLDLVVHFDPPVDAKTYLHRSGRTARAGASGTVVSLVQPDQAREVATLHSVATVSPRVVRAFPGHAAVRELATSGVPVVVTAAAPVEPVIQRPQSNQRPAGARRGGSSSAGGRPQHRRRTPAAR